MPTRHLSPSSLVRLVVEHVVASMTDARAAGVIRATIKLSTVSPIAIELFEDYRNEVTRLAVAVLSPRIPSNSTGAIRLGMQIVLATVTDAVLQPRPGPMAAGTKRMKDTLTQVMLSYLGVSEGRGWAGEEAEGADNAKTIPEPGDDDEDGTANGSEAAYDPDLRVFRRGKGPTKQLPKSKIRNSSGDKSALTSRDTKSATPPEPPLVKPPTVPKGLSEPLKPKRKHRII